MSVKYKRFRNIFVRRWKEKIDFKLIKECD